MGAAADQRITLERVTVENSLAGARRLGDEYLAEIGRSIRGVVRTRATREGVEVQPAGRITHAQLQERAHPAVGRRHLERMAQGRS